MPRDRHGQAPAAGEPGVQIALADPPAEVEQRHIDEGPAGGEGHPELVDVPHREGDARGDDQRVTQLHHQRQQQPPEEEGHQEPQGPRQLDDMQGELRAQPAALQREEQTEHQGGQHDALQQGAQGAGAERTRAAEHTGQHDEGRHSEGPACDVEGVQHVLPLHDAAHGVQNHDQCGGDEPGVVPPWIPGPFGPRSPLGIAGDGGGSREWLVHRGEAPDSGPAVTWPAALVIESGGWAHCARSSRRTRLPLQVHTVNPACTSGARGAVSVTMLAPEYQECVSAPGAEAAAGRGGTGARDLGVWFGLGVAAAALIGAALAITVIRSRRYRRERRLSVPSVTRWAGCPSAPHQGSNRTWLVRLTSSAPQ